MFLLGARRDGRTSVVVEQREACGSGCREFVLGDEDRPAADLARAEVGATHPRPTDLHDHVATARAVSAPGRRRATGPTCTRAHARPSPRQTSDSSGGGHVPGGDPHHTAGFDCAQEGSFPPAAKSDQTDSDSRGVCAAPSPGRRPACASSSPEATGRSPSHWSASSPSGGRPGGARPQPRPRRGRPGRRCRTRHRRPRGDRRRRARRAPPGGRRRRLRRGGGPGQHCGAQAHRRPRRRSPPRRRRRRGGRPALPARVLDGSAGRTVGDRGRLHLGRVPAGEAGRGDTASGTAPTSTPPSCGRAGSPTTPRPAG